MNLPRLLISAAHKSSGKTTICIGLCAALRNRGLRVAPFKKGPDYIDPMWLSLAAGRPCHNLDFFLMSHGEILATLAARACDAGMALMEGNKGLYDGLDLDGSNSNAALSKLTGAPVVLVIDARGMTRGIAPLLLGYQRFDSDIHIAGVILNQLGGSRHEAKLRAVIEYYTDIPVVGAVHHDEQLDIVERHLGLVPSNEDTAACARIDAIARAVAAQVDVDRVLAIAAAAPALPRVPPQALHASRSAVDDVPITIAIARDAAFGFYYPGDFDALREAGAELRFFNSLSDAHLPDCDGLFIGGGFPETHMSALEANTSLRLDIRRAIDGGLPAYAECGGLMYLTRSITWKGSRCQMVGVLPADTIMEERPQGRGYVRLRETGKGLWQIAPGAGMEIRAHEFHYSRLENLPDGIVFAYDVLRGVGTDGLHDGIVHRNLLACYTHMRDLVDNHWAARFAQFVRRCKHARPPVHAARRTN